MSCPPPLSRRLPVVRAQGKNGHLHKTVKKCKEKKNRRKFQTCQCTTKHTILHSLIVCPSSILALHIFLDVLQHVGCRAINFLRIFRCFYLFVRQPAHVGRLPVVSPSPSSCHNCRHLILAQPSYVRRLPHHVVVGLPRRHEDGPGLVSQPADGGLVTGSALGLGLPARRN